MRFNPEKWAKLHPNSPLALNYPLSKLTTFGIGGPAQIYAAAYDFGDLEALLSLSLDCRWPVYILGGGSNVLFADLGFRGLVIRLGPGFAQVQTNGSQIIAGAAAASSLVLKEARVNRLSGLEPLAGLPGSIGGAACRNAGGRFGAIGATVERIKILRTDGRIRDLYRPEIYFGYRSLRLGNNRGIILEVELSLEKETPEVIGQKIMDSLNLRVHQPKAPSAGCAFKNPGVPPKGGSDLDDVSGKTRAREILTAGQLIDFCGFKGHRIGGAMVSPEHANFIVNVGGARCSDVVALMREIKTEVLRSFGLELIPEICQPFETGKRDD